MNSPSSNCVHQNLHVRSKNLSLCVMKFIHLTRLGIQPLQAISVIRRTRESSSGFAHDVQPSHIWNKVFWLFACRVNVCSRYHLVLVSRVGGCGGYSLEVGSRNGLDIRCCGWSSLGGGNRGLGISDGCVFFGGRYGTSALTRRYWESFVWLLTWEDSRNL